MGERHWRRSQTAVCACLLLGERLPLSQPSLSRAQDHLGAESQETGWHTYTHAPGSLIDAPTHLNCISSPLPVPAVLGCECTPRRTLHPWFCTAILYRLQAGIPCA